MGWFSSSTDTYAVTALHQGWFGWSKVTARVTGRDAAKRLARKWRRRGDRDVRIRRAGWFS
jgi:hypothetical protein